MNKSIPKNSEKMMNMWATNPKPVAKKWCGISRAFRIVSSIKTKNYCKRIQKGKIQEDKFQEGKIQEDKIQEGKIQEG